MAEAPAAARPPPPEEVQEVHVVQGIREFRTSAEDDDRQSTQQRAAASRHQASGGQQAPTPVDAPAREFADVEEPWQLVSFEDAMKNSLYTPDARLLSERKREVSRSFRVQVSFCVTKHGNTTRVRVRPNSDATAPLESHCRQTLQRWRFYPFVQRGRAITTCTTAHLAFDLAPS